MGASSQYVSYNLVCRLQFAAKQVSSHYFDPRRHEATECSYEALRRRVHMVDGEDLLSDALDDRAALEAGLTHSCI